jgi:RHS repeat-associated protein
MLYNYRYDQLNRITGMDGFYGLDQEGNSWAGLMPTQDFKERVAYDGNGNIQKYLRNNFGETGLPMDSLVYGYQTGTNKLAQIRDSAADFVGGGYDLHSQPANNYAYDSIGNLIKDSIEHINSIKWNVYGKITEIDHSTTSLGHPTKNIYYYYDAAGNRIGKKITRQDSIAASYTWYVRDASGNVMATYTASEDTTQALSAADLHIGEKHIYGSSRLGILSANYSTDANTDGLSTYVSPWTGTHLPYYTGKKQYELTNHLGNVLATISDKKIGVSLSSDSSLIDHYEVDVQTAQDYYPFGMIMPGRMFIALQIPGGSVSGTTQVNGYTVPVDLTLSSRNSDTPYQYVATQYIDLVEGFTSRDSDDVTAYIADTSYAGTGNGGSDGVAGAGKYRYGFNGKEQDNEVKGIGDQIDYGMRVYDPRAGRFLSVDPLQKKYPWFTPYQFAGNNPIANVDLDGRENYSFHFVWDAKIKGFNCIDVYVQKNEQSFWDLVVDREPAKWTGKPVKGWSFTYEFNGELYASYQEMLNYHAAHPDELHQNSTSGKMSDAQQALAMTAFLAAGELAAQSMENGSSIDPQEVITEEEEVLSGEYSILKASMAKEEKDVALKTTSERTASAHNGIPEASKANTGAGGNKTEAVVHKNSNEAEGHFVLYEVSEDGVILKVGKTNADDVMADGTIRRVHTSERKAKESGYPDANAKVVQDLGKTTTGKAKEAEAKRVRDERKAGNTLPLNKEKDKKYQP